MLNLKCINNIEILNISGGDGGCGGALVHDKYEKQRCVNDCYARYDLKQDGFQLRYDIKKQLNNKLQYCIGYCEGKYPF